MSDTTKISWCDHTFNPWIGCSKVSEECRHCYAEALARRWYHDAQWGSTGARHRTTEANWAKVRNWNARAIERDESARVFCASLADVFEAHPSLSAWREDLFELIKKCPALDWMLLTKRPENVMRMVPDAWRHRWPRHVWIGASVGTQESTSRFDELLRIPAAVRFVSAELLLEPVDLWPWISQRRGGKPAISLVITGGESGHGARPVHPDWVRAIRNDCNAAGVVFHHKQWGAWAPASELASDQDARIGRRTYEFQDGSTMHRMRGKDAGAQLDGIVMQEMPPRRQLS